MNVTPENVTPRTSLLASIALVPVLLLAACTGANASAGGSVAAVSSADLRPAGAEPAVGVVAQGQPAQAETAGAPAFVPPAAASGFTRTAAAGDPTGTGIVVQGTGKVTGTPDVVTISLGVESHDPSAKAALDANNTLANGVIDTIKAAGVAPADLQTSQLSVYPSYSDKGVITGYQVSNIVTATLRDISTAGALIDAVGAKAGDAIRVQSLTFSIDDASTLRSAARADAVKRAQAQAKELADAAGVQLGAVQSITETPSYDQPVYQTMAASASADAAAAPVQPGSLELNVNVQVVFAIG